jgi:hypothetical protein
MLSPLLLIGLVIASYIAVTLSAPELANPLVDADLGGQTLFLFTRKDAWQVAVPAFCAS